MPVKLWVQEDMNILNISGWESVLLGRSTSRLNIWTRKYKLTAAMIKLTNLGKRENFSQSKFLLQNNCSLIILPQCFYTIILHYERLAQLWSKQLYVRVFPRERIFEAPLNINMLKLYLFFYEWLGFFSHISLNRCLNC